MKSKAKKFISHFLLTGVTLGVSCSYASSKINDKFMTSMKDTGATVLQSRIWASVDCRKLPISECDNYPNPSLMYQMPLVPCSPEKGCTQGNDKLIPFKDVSSAWHLDKDEAVVLIANQLAPSKVYWSFELELYERYLSNIPRVWDYKGPKAGEILPDPIAHKRFVVSGAVGESANQLNTHYGPIEINNNQQGYVQIYSANKNVTQKIVDQLVSLGYPKEFINIYGLPDVYVNENSDQADTYRVIGRIGHSYGAKHLAKWIKDNPIGIFRVTFNEKDESPIGYDHPELLDPSVGKKELDGFEVQWDEFNRDIEVKFGSPSKVINPTGRSYSTDFCADTGSYCWGYNRDALYLNINDPVTKETADFDLGKSENSKIVITGVDHVQTGFTTFWNFGIFADTGKLRSSFDFGDIAQDSPMFWMQIKLKCETGDKNCIEANLKRKDGTIVRLINRNYLNSYTATAPLVEEIALPVIYYYE